jgi:hypothetical protein
MMVNVNRCVYINEAIGYDLRCFLLIVKTRKECSYRQ